MVGAALDNCQHEYEKDLNVRQELQEEMQSLHLLSCLIYVAMKRTGNILDNMIERSILLPFVPPWLGYIISAISYYLYYSQQ